MSWEIAVVLLVALVFAGWLVAMWRRQPIDPKTYETLVALHAIRRRLELARFRSEVRGDAARARRELRGDLEKRGRR